MSTELLWALLVFVVVTCFTPGPNNTMRLASGLNFGFRRALPHLFSVALARLRLDPEDPARQPARHPHRQCDHGAVARCLAVADPGRRVAVGQNAVAAPGPIHSCGGRAEPLRL
jgi:hypothetical protein